MAGRENWRLVKQEGAAQQQLQQQTKNVDFSG